MTLSDDDDNCTVIYAAEGKIGHMVLRDVYREEHSQSSSNRLFALVEHGRHDSAYKSNPV